MSDASKEILTLDLAKGESQHVEFKADFPDSGLKLGKSIAAFAGSNAGRIYLGVDKSGSAVGVSAIRNLTDQTGKDEMQRRIQGVARNDVDPPVRVTVNFVEVEGKIVVQILVPRGEEPVYFCKGTAYVRDLSTNRHLTAPEVKELYRKYFEGLHIPEATEEESFSLQVLVQLGDLLLIASDYKDHMMEPGLTQMKYDLAATGRILLEHSTSSIARHIGTVDGLKRLALTLDDLGSARLTAESLAEFGTKLEACKQLAESIVQQLRKRLVDTTITDFDDAIHSSIELLKSEWEQREKYLERGEIDRLRETFHTVAFKLYSMGLTPQAEKQGLAIQLRDLGLRIRNLSSYQKYFLRYSSPTLLEAPMREVLDLCEDITGRMQKRA